MSKKLVSLRVDQQVKLDASFIDAAGNVFTSVGEYKPTWSYDSNFFKAEFSDNGMSATFTPNGQLGESNIVAVFNGLRDEFAVTVTHGNVTDLDVGVTIAETSIDEEALAANVAKDAEASGVQAAAAMDAAASFTPEISVAGVNESVAMAEVAQSVDAANEQVAETTIAGAGAENLPVTDDLVKEQSADINTGYADSYNTLVEQGEASGQRLDAIAPPVVGSVEAVGQDSISISSDEVGSVESLLPELVNGAQLVELNGQTVEAVVRLSEAGGVAVGIDAPLLRPASEPDDEVVSIPLAQFQDSVAAVQAESPAEDTVAVAADTAVDVPAESIVQIGSGGDVAFVDTQVPTDSAEVPLATESSAEEAPVALTTIEEVAAQETPIVEAIATTDAETAAAVQAAVDETTTQQSVAQEVVAESVSDDAPADVAQPAAEGEQVIDPNTPVLATESRGPYQG